MFRVITMVMVLLFSALPVNAHKMKSAFTIVLFNERTNHIEVMHRFMLHDAEEAAWQLFDAKADIIADDMTQAKFAAYVEEKFELRNSQNEALPLSLVGYQNDAGYFWVYQEIKMPKRLKGLAVRQDSLREIWDEQFNIVNIEGRGPATSLHFEGSETWKRIELPELVN
ncbi:hypothetical protein GCM10009128_09120 [Psychrosphaera haliotis]|uniref:DUF6702 family protein n=1 Tax=Psychrosphaera haliotis TaxID=555083 RepID=UPI0031D4ECED